MTKILDIERIIKDIGVEFSDMQACSRVITSSLYEYAHKRNRLAYDTIRYLSSEHKKGDYSSFIDEGEIALDLLYKALRYDDELLAAYEQLYFRWIELNSYKLSDEESEEYFPNQRFPKVRNITEFREYLETNLDYFFSNQEQMLATFEKMTEPADRIKPLF